MRNCQEITILPYKNFFFITKHKLLTHFKILQKIVLSTLKLNKINLIILSFY